MNLECSFQLAITQPQRTSMVKVMPQAQRYRWLRAHALQSPTKNWESAYSEEQHRALQTTKVIRSCFTRIQRPYWPPPNHSMYVLREKTDALSGARHRAIVQCKRQAWLGGYRKRLLAHIDPRKISVKNYRSMTWILDFTLIRTDTTLDLSQKAEKVSVTRESLYIQTLGSVGLAIRNHGIL